jgi:glycosyltransferase involved in cell wall biosynthesis
VEQAIFDVADRRAPEPFLLCVSTLHPHKGIDSLLGAFTTFRQTRPEFRLVLAGMRGFAADAIDARIESLGLVGSVEVTGWVPRERIYDLYRRAWAFVYPSRFEGFGMPVAEAMAAGVPVACSDIEPLRSVAGNAAVLFPPGDETAMADSLSRIAGDERLRVDLVERARMRAAQFTWEGAARETLAVLEAALAS